MVAERGGLQVATGISFFLILLLSRRRLLSSMKVVVSMIGKVDVY